MNNNDLHVIFGASGGAGSALARELVERGKRVRAVTRSGNVTLPGVESIKADAANLDEARQACQGAAVVYNCANVPYPDWLKKFPSIFDGITEGAASAKARLIVADNLYMYGRVSAPLTENLPYRATTRKGKLRAQMAEALMAAHQSGKVRVAIARGSDYYGPGIVNALAGAEVFRAVLAGKQAMWVGRLNAPHTLTFSEDFAHGMATLGERDDMLGQAWHIPAAEPLTGREFLRLAFDVAGKPPKIGCYTRPVMSLVGLFSPMVREAAEMLYQFEEPFIMDGSKFARAVGGFTPTPHRAAIRRTLEAVNSSAGKK